MENLDSRNIKYFSITPIDEQWGIIVSTVGYQLIPPNTEYPRSKHPESHIFNVVKGRVLKEYQLIYISQGSGWFESRSCKKTRIKAGMMIMIFPDEWHSYRPDRESGWFEYWVGFKGPHIDKRIENEFFNKKNPVFNPGISSTIINAYEDIVNYAFKEKSGYQQLISSIVLMLLGIVYYRDKNASFKDSLVVTKINESRAIMKKEINNPRPTEEIAKELNVSYSWFRQMFKKYTGLSPSRYQMQLKLLRAKELLETTDMNISEIAYSLSFESPGSFCTFFGQREGMSPSQYRKEIKSLSKNN